MGGYGNHVRWLLLLDSTFQSSELNFAGDANSKVNFILKNVYFNERSWHNWIEIEFRFRQQFNRLIFFTHTFDKLIINDDDTCTLIVVSPELCYSSYIKLNTLNHKASKKDFMNWTAKSNLLEEQRREYLPNFRVQKSDILFQEELDYNWYHEIVSSLHLEDNYNHAKLIHKKWYQLHKKAEKDIVRDLFELYNLEINDILSKE